MIDCVPFLIEPWLDRLVFIFCSIFEALYWIFCLLWVFADFLHLLWTSISWLLCLTGEVSLLAFFVCGVAWLIISSVVLIAWWLTLCFFLKISCECFASSKFSDCFILPDIIFWLFSCGNKLRWLFSIFVCACVLAYWVPFHAGTVLGTATLISPTLTTNAGTQGMGESGEPSCSDDSN